MRVLALLCMDWPVVSAVAAHPALRGRAVAVVANNRVVACNAAARMAGVNRPLRRRDAQGRCPELALVDANPDRDARDFEPVLAAVESLRPGVASLWPGLLAVRSPARFYGGDEHAAAVLAQTVVEAGVWDVRAGIADDLTTAVHAAHLAEIQSSRIVPEGAVAEFWRGRGIAELLVSARDADFVELAEMVSVLNRLGLRQIGDFAALSTADVVARFGARGARLHRVVRGEARGLLDTRTPPPELSGIANFEPPLESSEAIAFSVRQICDRFVSRLRDRELVCTCVGIQAETDTGSVLERSWMHSGWFTAADLVDRVHWQLQAAARAGAIDAPIRKVTFVPEALEAADMHAETLWGGANNERVERGIAKVQGLLGYEAACRVVRQGGRGPADRQTLVPWGEKATGLRPGSPPWPGSIPAPAPCRVFTEPISTLLECELQQPISVSEHGLISGAPTRFRPPGGGWQQVQAWTGPWPAEERWWEAGTPVRTRRAARFQVVGADGRAWLLRCDSADSGPLWWIEAGYD